MGITQGVYVLLLKCIHLTVKNIKCTAYKKNTTVHQKIIRFYKKHR